MDPLLEKAIAEAYASAPQGEIPLHSLEVNHFTFTEGPARVMRWPVTGPEPDRFLCLLEDDAPFNPGQTVEFIGAPFEILLPEKSTESPGQFKLRVDNIGDLLDEYLENAALSGGKITAIYREFLKGQELDGPASVWPGIILTSPRMEGQTLTMDGAILDWVFRAYGQLYVPSDYPGLIAGR
jgi:hypothetical protein